MNRKGGISVEVGFPGLLTSVFIVLKLTHVIQWSWWWVFSPLWVTFFLALIVTVSAFVFVKTRRRV